MTVSNADFRAAILNADQPVPVGLSDGQGAAAGKRFSVYRNNVAVSLTEALRTGFPVIHKLLGDQNMDGLAGMFLRQHPPSSAVMMHYGAEFPQFLAQIPALSHLPYLADVARLELAMRASYHAADATPLDPSVLHAMPPEDVANHCFHFAPSMKLIRSKYPLFDIWAFNMADGPKPSNTAQNVIVTRPEFDPLPDALPAGAATFITALQEGETFGTAHDITQAAAPTFDLGATLSLLMSRQVFTKITLKETT